MMLWVGYIASKTLTMAVGYSLAYTVSLLIK